MAEKILPNQADRSLVSEGKPGLGDETPGRRGAVRGKV